MNALKKMMAMKDPRDYQLMNLFCMLFYGLIWLKFDLNPWWLCCILLTAFVTQVVATRLWKLPRLEWRSAMISGLSLCLLMRCPSLSLSLGLAAAAILSKFIFRWNNKHIFNPTNFALALGLLATNQMTISPGQWGHGAIFAFFLLCMGLFVSNKACRHDVSIAFLATYALGLVAFTVYTNGSFDLVAEKLQTGSLLIFTFFMISDPRSTADSRWGRVIFGVSVALLGLYLQLAQHYPGGLMVSLASLSLMTPFLDRLLPGTRFEWNTANPKAAAST